MAVISVADVYLETSHLFYFLLDQERFGEEARREKQKHRKRNSPSHRPKRLKLSQKETKTDRK